jgi:DNA-binding NtrC family response regulator
MMLNRLASYSETGKKTVMICDDERDLLELFGKALQKKYNIILVGSGEDCIDKYIEERTRVTKYIS